MIPFAAIIPSDPAEQRQLARRLARLAVLPAHWKARAPALSPADRIRFGFPLGVERGALSVVNIALDRGLWLPAKLRRAEPPGRAIWAAGLAAGVQLPPAGTFGRGGPGMMSAAFRMGYEQGILLALEALSLRERPAR